MHLWQCRVILVAGFFLSITGCSWSRHPTEVLSAESVPIVDDGKVIDLSRLRPGRSVVILPFNAGTQVEASDELDKIALMLVKGAAETFQENPAALKVLFPGEKSQADLFLQGHVTRLTKKSAGAKRWLGRASAPSLTVEGDLVERKTGKVVLHFVHGKKAQDKGEDHRALGWEIGKDIARFIISEINEGREASSLLNP